MSEPGAVPSLADHVANWNPEPTTVHDTLTAHRVNELAATLDVEQRFGDGDPLPLLWQWIFFLDWPATAELGADGHPRHGHFLPPIPNRRRMFAGGRVTVNAPLVIGRPATRHSQITGTAAKSGRTGELLFVSVRHVYRQESTECVVEEQDLVYRSDEGAATPFARVTAPLTMPPAAWTSTPVTHPALLFRFSALTGNAHRIHYDQAYATGTEGFPALVVHGPLLAVYMSELLRANAGGRSAQRFEFRLRRPVFLGDQIGVAGAPDGASVTLSVVSGDDDVHASASATLG